MSSRVAVDQSISREPASEELLSNRVEHCDQIPSASQPLPPLCPRPSGRCSYGRRVNCCAGGIWHLSVFFGRKTPLLASLMSRPKRSRRPATWRLADPCPRRCDAPHHLPRRGSGRLKVLRAGIAAEGEQSTLWTTHSPAPTANVWTSLTVKSHIITDRPLPIALDRAERAVELLDLRAGPEGAASTQPSSVRNWWFGVVSIVSPSIRR